MSTPTLDAPCNGHVLQLDEGFTDVARTLVQQAATATDTDELAHAPNASATEPLAGEPHELADNEHAPGLSSEHAPVLAAESGVIAGGEDANASASREHGASAAAEPALTSSATSETAVADTASASTAQPAELASAAATPIVRKGLAGAIAELGEQCRANATARHERRQHSRDRRSVRRGSTTGDGWLSRSLAHGQRSLGEIAFVMALIGSAFGQTLWWASTLNIPSAFALSFSATFEAIMLGADRRAMDRRRRHRNATTLRALSWLFAGVAAWMQLSHFSTPGVVAEVFGMQIHGSLQLGIAFTALTIGGFLIHTLSGNARVNDTLIDEGYIRPLGAGRWTYPLRAFRARRLLVDQPHLTVEQAWERTRTPRRGSHSARAAYRLGALRTLLFWMPFLGSQPDSPQPAAPTVPEQRTPDASTQPTPRVEQDQTSAQPAEQTAARPSRRASTSKPQNKTSKAAAALAWVQQQISSEQHPTPTEIKRRFELSNPHAELKRWRDRGQITEHDLARIKAA